MTPAAALLLEALEDVAARREVLELLLPELRVALAAEGPAQDGWLNSRDAAGYLGMSLEALKKRMHEIPSEQDMPGGRRWYRRADLDAWRIAGARVLA